MGPDRNGWVDEAAHDEEYLLVVVTHWRESAVDSRGKRDLVMMKRERKREEKRRDFYFKFFLSQPPRSGV